MLKAIRYVRKFSAKGICSSLSFVRLLHLRLYLCNHQTLQPLYDGGIYLSYKWGRYIHSHLPVSVLVLHHDGVVVGRVVHHVGQVLLTGARAAEPTRVLLPELHCFCHSCHTLFTSALCTALRTRMTPETLKLDFRKHFNALMVLFVKYNVAAHQLTQLSCQLYGATIGCCFHGSTLTWNQLQQQS